MANVLEVKNIYKKYGEKHIEVIALKGLFSAVQSGEFIAVTDPSGSGKGTFLTITAGLQTPTSGEAIVGG